MSPQALLITSRKIPVDAVQRALERRGFAVCVLQTDSLPAQLSLSIRPDNTVVVRQGDQRVVLDDLQTVWYRRARYSTGARDLPPGVRCRSPISRSMATNESFAAKIPNPA